MTSVGSSGHADVDYSQRGERQGAMGQDIKRELGSPPVLGGAPSSAKKKSTMHDLCVLQLSGLQYSTPVRSAVLRVSLFSVLFLFFSVT